MGTILNKIGMYRNGLRFIEEASNFNYNNSDVLFQKAYVLLKLGLFNNSIENILKLIDVSPNSFDGRQYLILLESYLKINEIDERIIYCINKISEFGTPEVLYLTGNILQQYNKKDCATEIYKLASNCNDYPEFYLKKYRYWIFWSGVRLYYLEFFNKGERR